MTRSAGRLAPTLVALSALAALAACGGKERQPPPTAPAAMGWFQPERFEDLPLWTLGSYKLSPDEQQLAIATAGGAVRRLSLSYRSPPHARGEAPATLLQRLAPELASAGWSELSRTTGKDQAVEGRWRKPDEELVVAAGRDGDATTVRLLLGPAPR